MNIFLLDYDIELNARAHCDKHVLKMIIEYTQMLSTASRLNGVEQGYKIAHRGHPCTKWVCSSKDNWLYLKTLVFLLQIEYRRRYGGTHKSYLVAKDLCIPPLPLIGFTQPYLAMPDQYKTNDYVESYRNYYIGDKRRFATWKLGDIPEWFK